jgi:hypothetical protein
VLSSSAPAVAVTTPPFVPNGKENGA